MKKVIFIFCAVLCCVFMGCSKGSILNPVETGNIQFVNNNSDPYGVVVKGNTSLQFVQNARTSVYKTVEVGYYNVKVIQQSGYIFYPTEKEYSFYVKENQTTVVSY